MNRINGFSLVRLGIEPRIIKLQENPLRPLEILDVGGGEFARPVVAEAEAFDLAREIGDVRLGRHARMLAGLDGVLLGRQAERIPAHRMQHVEAARATIARENIRGRVALGMSDMQARAARIRKHVEDVKFLRQLRGGNFAGKFMARGKGMVRGNFLARIERAESLLFLPSLLPLGFDQMKRILSAAAGHRATNTTRNDAGLNRGVQMRN